MLSLSLIFVACSVARSLEIEPEAKPYCFSRSEAELIFVCLKKSQPKPSEAVPGPSLMEPWQEKALWLSLGIVLGYAARAELGR